MFPLTTFQQPPTSLYFTAWSRPDEHFSHVLLFLLVPGVAVKTVSIQTACVPVFNSPVHGSNNVLFLQTLHVIDCSVFWV